MYLSYFVSVVVSYRVAIGCIMFCFLRVYLGKLFTFKWVFLLTPFGISIGMDLLWSFIIVISTLIIVII